MGICQSYKNKRKISEENVNADSGPTNGDYTYKENKNSMEPDTNKLEKIFKIYGKLFNDKNIVYKMK